MLLSLTVVLTLGLCVTLATLTPVIVGQETLELKYRFEEEQEAGTQVGDVIRDANLHKIYDPTSIHQLQFRFLRQYHPGWFVIDNGTGVIRSGARIDREAICPGAETCDLRIDVAIQPLQRFRIIRVTVTIDDINDNQPEFSGGERIVEVLESASPGTVLLIPSALDLDGPAFTVQSYKIVSDDGSDRFELVGSGSDEVKLVLAGKLDRETVDMHRVRIVAIDGGYPPKSGHVDLTIIVLDVNDNQPVFDKSNYTAIVPENAPSGTSILQVHAVDFDADLNGQVTYSFSPATSSLHGHLIGIDAKTGDIYVRGEIDHEDTAVYRLVVVARDRGADSVPVNVPVTIHVEDMNDNLPEMTIETLSATPGLAEIAEDSGVGMFVALVTVADRDSGENGKFSCRINDTAFRLVPTSRDNSEYQIVTGTLLDRESTSRYNFALLCEDFGLDPQTSTGMVTIKVTDVNDCSPVFDQAIYRADLIENNYVGAVLIQVNATDEDEMANGQVVYSIEGDAVNLFSVEMANGQVVYSIEGDAVNLFSVEADTGSIKAASTFDREQAEVVEFTVVARDRGMPPRSASAKVLVTILDVNDEHPRFSHPTYSFAVRENQPFGTEVGTVAASDLDSGIYGEITYRIVTSALISDVFDINHKTGTITTVRVLDRELQSVYYLIAEASDRGVPPKTSSASVTIYIADENDNSPIFEFPTPNNNSVQVSSFAPRNHIVTRIRARDSDFGKNAKITFNMTDETKTGLFDVDISLGTVTVAGDLTDKDGQQFVIEFLAKDEGVPERITFGRLNLIVNKSAPFPLSRSEEDLDGPAGQNFMIVFLLAVISGVVIIILIVAIVVVCRQDRDKDGDKYNCRVETMKMMTKGGVGEGIPPSDCEMYPTTPEVDRKFLPATCTTNNETEHADRRFDRKPSRDQLLQPPTDPDDATTHRQLKALQTEDCNSSHSGEGSNTDSGRGPSVEDGDHAAPVTSNGRSIINGATLQRKNSSNVESTPLNTCRRQISNDSKIEIGPNNYCHGNQDIRGNHGNMGNHGNQYSQRGQFSTFGRSCSYKELDARAGDHPYTGPMLVNASMDPRTGLYKQTAPAPPPGTTPIMTSPALNRRCQKFSNSSCQAQTNGHLGNGSGVYEKNSINSKCHGIQLKNSYDYLHDNGYQGNGGIHGHRAYQNYYSSLPRGGESSRLNTSLETSNDDDSATTTSGSYIVDPARYS